ncbi:37S ribosomal protein S9, mitochondrial [Entophlyctis sp. JEL0112]|nr:37S ribosomal protein S9, mitochondrial [Entophlyctis sp. JEL0112]
MRRLLLMSASAAGPLRRAPCLALPLPVSAVRARALATDAGPAASAGASVGVGAGSGDLYHSVDDAAFFTGNPHYYALLMRVNSLIRLYNLPMRDPAVYRHPDVGPLPQWMPIKEMSALKQFRLTFAMYDDLIHKLNVLYSIREKPSSLTLLLQQYVRPGQQLTQPEKPVPQLDADGRAFARASRKTAKAQAWVVRGSGEIFINGVHISEYFSEIPDRELIVRPFEVANALGRFNVWAIVSGGGKSGQAGAVAVATARALAVHVPEVATDFALSGLTKIDRRQVERKKTGQPKARKKNTWLKR